MPSCEPATLVNRARAILIFAIILTACTMFLGDIGVYNDDYFCNQRDPVTGEVHDLVMNRPWHLWRPLTRRVLSPLVTLLWPHPWMLHSIDALIHGVITVMVYALLRRFRVHPGIAGPCALAFMVYPGHFEAVLWITETCTLFSMLLVLAAWHLCLWWLTHSHVSRIPIRLGALIAVGGFAWCAAALNEQPPAALAAIPFAALAVGPASGRSRAHRLIRTSLPVLAAAIGLAVYLRGFVRHTPGFHDLSMAQHGAPERAADLARQIPAELILLKFIPGAWKQGLSAFGDHPGLALLLFGGVILLGLLWCFGTTRESGRKAQQDRPASLALTAIGLVWAAAVWGPVAFAHSHPVPRLFYPCAVGLTIAMAGLASMLRVPAWATRASRFCFAAAVVAAIIVWIGIQDGYQRRFRADVAEVEPLARVFGRTIEPGSIFIPVHVASRSTETGVPRFDDFFQQCWRWPLAAGWRLRIALHNPDVHTICTGAGAAARGFAVNPRDPAGSVICTPTIAPPEPANAGELLPVSPYAPGRVFPWSRLVVFDVEGAGNTQIYTRVRVHAPAGEVIEFVPRQVALSPLAATLPERILDVYPYPHPPERSGQR